jgi:MFS family permease
MGCGPFQPSPHITLSLPARLIRIASKGEIRFDNKGYRTMALAPNSEGFRTLLKKKNFLRLWLAQLLSMTILNASNYALLILIEEQTHSTTLIGLAIISFSLPAILFGAPAGVFVDHMHKRRVLWISNCLRAIATLLFVFSLLLNRGDLLPIYILTFIISSIGQFFAPAEGASIPMLVTEDELTPALSLFNVTFMLSQALGFVLFAPILLSLLPTFTVFHIQLDAIIQLYILIACLYLVCAILILFIPPHSFKSTPNENTSLTPISSQTIGALNHMWQEMWQGWRFIRTNKQLFQAVLQLSFAGILLLVIGQLATPIVKQLLGLPPTAMAFVFAPAGVGLVLGSILMPRIMQALQRPRAIFIGIVALTLVTLLIPSLTMLAKFLQPTTWNNNPLLSLTVALLMFVAGIALDFVNIPSQTTMQALSPDWIKGRVLSLQLVLYNALSIPIILFIGGLSDLYGIRQVLYLLAAGQIAFGIWGIYYEHKHPLEPITTEDKDTTSLMGESETENVHLH